MFNSTQKPENAWAQGMFFGLGVGLSLAKIFIDYVGKDGNFLAFSVVGIVSLALSYYFAKKK
ncbi:MAG TPA: hypothetical protein DEP87_01700 [Candidatus Pacebacteria bacterium]|nr:hypothetical protein [Candidatus Paceibacterota bacterium]